MIEHFIYKTWTTSTLKNGEKIVGGANLYLEQL